MNIIIGYRGNFVYWLIGGDVAQKEYSQIWRADYVNDVGPWWYCEANAVYADIKAHGPYYNENGEPITI